MIFWMYFAFSSHWTAHPSTLSTSFYISRKKIKKTRTSARYLHQVANRWSLPWSLGSLRLQWLWHLKMIHRILGRELSCGSSRELRWFFWYCGSASETKGWATHIHNDCFQIHTCMNTTLSTWLSDTPSFNEASSKCSGAMARRIPSKTNVIEHTDRNYFKKRIGPLLTIKFDPVGQFWEGFHWARQFIECV